MQTAGRHDNESGRKVLLSKLRGSTSKVCSPPVNDFMTVRHSAWIWSRLPVILSYKQVCN